MTAGFCPPAAKDCIDIQVRVAALDEDPIVGPLARIGFRLRPEPWNRIETTAAGQWPKLFFAPPAEERARNVQVRVHDSAAPGRNLLFRDILRANATARNVWADFQRRLALIAPDIHGYGQAKTGPTEILMIAAESWASDSNWTVPGAPALHECGVFRSTALVAPGHEQEAAWAMTSWVAATTRCGCWTWM